MRSSDPFSFLGENSRQKLFVSLIRGRQRPSPIMFLFELWGFGVDIPRQGRFLGASGLKFMMKNGRVPLE